MACSSSKRDLFRFDLEPNSLRVAGRLRLTLPSLVPVIIRLLTLNSQLPLPKTFLFICLSVGTVRDVLKGLLLPTDYSGSDFEAFLIAGATRCTDGVKFGVEESPCQIATHQCNAVVFRLAGAIIYLSLIHI